MHCFSGDVSLAGQVLALGFYISIPGIVTFKNATDLQQVVREIPLEHMLLETDGPFLAPVPWRGKRNQPAHLLYTAAKVAALMWDEYILRHDLEEKRNFKVKRVAKMRNEAYEQMFGKMRS
jgi:TatD family hydrolase